jgi:hypothetical protein
MQLQFEQVWLHAQAIMLQVSWLAELCLQHIPVTLGIPHRVTPLCLSESQHDHAQDLFFKVCA